MPVTVKNISLWRKEVENQVGTLAHTLEPVTKAGANLHVLMGYRYPGEGTRAAIEFYPIAGKKVSSWKLTAQQFVNHANVSCQRLLEGRLRITLPTFTTALPPSVTSRHSVFT